MIKLIAQTTGAGELEGKTAEEIISYAARVSNPENQDNFDTSAKLLKYCIKHGHWSVFETAAFTIEIKTSRGIAAQILRHRSFCFQEFSQRYSASTSILKHSARRQDLKNKQNSIDDMSDIDKSWFNDIQDTLYVMSMSFYNEALKRGIAKEIARFLLPLSTETTLYMTGSVRSWIHYVNTRADPSTQKEHRDIALAVKALLIEKIPSIAEALDWKI